MENNDSQTRLDQKHAPLDNASPTAVVLGKNVTRMRKQAKITKQKFALMVDIGRPFLNRIENGTADPRLSIVLRLAAALETTPQELLTDCSAPAQTARIDTSGHAQLR